MKRTQYSSDLTEQEWLLLKDLMPPAKLGGHPRTVEIREILNAGFSENKPGSSSIRLPKNFPEKI